MKTIIFTLLIILFCDTSSAHNDWIPYSPQPIPPQVIVSSVPSVTYSTEISFVPRPYILTYDWVPYYSTRTTVVERVGFMCKYRTVIKEPIIEWVYQPVWR